MTDPEIYNPEIYPERMRLGIETLRKAECPWPMGNSYLHYLGEIETMAGLRLESSCPAPDQKQKVREAIQKAMKKEVKEDKKFCGYCGTQLEIRASFCGNCGKAC